MTTHVRSSLEDISPNDKCDQCPAPALLAVLIGDKNGLPIGTLMFCKHHGNEHEVALFGTVKIIDVIDNRATLDPDEKNVWIEDLLK